MNEDEGRALLLETNPREEYTETEIQCVNQYFISFLKKLLETDVLMKEEEKRMIRNYFTNFCDISFSNMIQYPITKEIVKKLNDVLDYGLSGRADDTQFLLNYYSMSGIGSMVQVNVENLLEEYKQGKNDNIEQLEDIASLIRNYSLSDDFIQEVLDVLEQTGKDRNHNKIIDNYMERYFYYMQDDPYNTFEDIAERSLEEISNYFQSIVHAENFNIFNEQWLTDFIQLKTTGKLSPQYQKMISEIMQEDIDVSEIKSEISDFMKLYQEKSPESEIEFDEFVKKLGEVKLHTGIIPRDAVDFIMKQILDKKSIISQNPNKYQGLVERIIEAFASWDLAGRVKLKQEYCYFVRNNILGKTSVLGLHDSDQYITLSQKKIIELLQDKNLDVLDAIFHENTHAEQQYDMQNSKFENLTRYMMVKDQILMKEKEGYYRANYRYCYNEIDARQSAARKLKRYLENLNINLEDVFLGNISGRQIYDELQRRIEEENTNMVIGEDKRAGIAVNRKTDIYEMLDEIIARKPEYLQQYPILNIEYNANGQKKDIAELLEVISISKTHAQSSMIVHMFETGKIITRENLKSAITVLAEFDCQNDRRIEDTLSLIVAHNLGTIFTEIKNEISSLSPEELKKIMQEMQEIKNTILSTNYTKAFGRGMNHHPRRDERTAIQKILDAERQVDLKMIDFGMPKMDKQDVFYDDDMIERYQESLEMVKRAINIEAQAVENNDMESVGISRQIYENAFHNFSLHPWGEEFAKEMAQYREKKLKGIHTAILVERAKWYDEDRIASLSSEELVKSISDFNALCAMFDYADRTASDSVRNALENMKQSRVKSLEELLQKAEREMEYPENETMVLTLRRELSILDPESYQTYMKKRELIEGAPMSEIMEAIAGKRVIQNFELQTPMDHPTHPNLKRIQILQGYDALDAHICKKSEYLERKLELLRQNLHIPGNQERYVRTEKALEAMEDKWNEAIFKRNLSVYRNGERVVSFGGYGKHHIQRVTREQRRKGARNTVEWTEQFRNWYDISTSIETDAKKRYGIVGTVKKLTKENKDTIGRRDE